MSEPRITLQLWSAWDRLGGGPIGYRLTDSERDVMKSDCGLKHAHWHTGSTVQAAYGFQKVKTTERYKPSEIGVITTGGPLQLEVAWTFLERAFQLGPGAVNPLVFPHTIVSSVPTSLAAAVQAQAFAFAVGHDVHAFFQVVRRAKSMIEAGLCKVVLIAACFDANPKIERISQGASVGSMADAAVCGIVQYEDLISEDHWCISEIQLANKSCLTDIPTESGSQEFRYSFNGWRLQSSSHKSSLERASAATASGAVVCLEAMKSTVDRSVLKRIAPSCHILVEGAGKVSSLKLDLPKG